MLRTDESDTTNISADFHWSYLCKQKRVQNISWTRWVSPDLAGLFLCYVWSAYHPLSKCRMDLPASLPCLVSSNMEVQDPFVLKPDGIPSFSRKLKIKPGV